MKIDFHVHSCYSSDAIGTLEEIAKWAKLNGIDVVVITDHDYQAFCGVKIVNSVYLIAGIEISTRYGHILGLNLSEQIDLKLAKEEPLKAIKDAGGFSALAHPFDFPGKRNLNLITEGIEVINSKSFPFQRNTKLAFDLAKRFNLAKVAGSDSHIPMTIGHAYVEVNTSSIDEAMKIIFLEKKGRQFGRPTGLQDRIKHLWLRLKSKKFGSKMKEKRKL